VVLDAEGCGAVGTAGAAADVAASRETGCAFEVAGFPFARGVWVAGVHGSPGEGDGRAVADDTEVAFLNHISRGLERRRGLLPNHSV
jgi:hypothetical protein